LDNEVAVFRIKISDLEFNDLKDKADIGGIESTTINVTQVFETYKQNIA